MTTSPERRRHQRVRSFLSRALDLPEEERRAYLNRSLGEGETLREALELLREIGSLDDFLERPLEFDRGGGAEYEPPVPDAVAGFSVTRVLGWGAMGVVYLAHQATPRRPVALKVLRLDAATASAAKRFRREADALARLSHPGIARVYDAGLADLGAGSQPYIAMEYVEGDPLGKYVAERSPSTRERVELAVRIADAVDHAHRHGVLHRDLKPDNVLVDADGAPRVLDFGVARVASDEELGATLTGTGQLVGTVAYMAPEQARGANVDERADLYALATVLYELLTEELPVDVRGRMTHEALRIVADERGVPLRRRRPDLGRDLDAVLDRALAHSPEDRYGSVRAFADDLRRWLEGRPVRVRPLGGIGRLRRFALRNRGLSAAVALFLLGAGAAIAFVVSARLDAQRLRLFSEVLRGRLRVERLRDDASTLWPNDLARRAEFEAWLAEAHTLLARLPAHRETLAWLQGGRRAWSGELPGGEYRVEWKTTTEELVGSLEDLERSLEDMRRRGADLAEMEHVLARDVPAWEAAAARVARDARFAGFALDPIAGLVPLGPDPSSGLEEFGLWRFTGRTPRRLPSGALELREDTGLVLVLIPGGEVLVGAQDVDPTARNYDASSRPNSEEYQNEGPPFTVRLDPFLLSKYEMTQAQWSQAFGFNPSDWEVGAKPYADESPVTAQHPVESVSWLQAMHYLPRIGLTLPTEAQWETAARCGADHAYMTGKDWRSLLGHVNARTGLVLVDPWPDDGYRMHMPVGSFLPNRYGLHDLMGNVWELCMDIYKVRYHTSAHDEGTGLVRAEFDGDVARRGPGWAASPSAMRVAKRETRLFDGGDPGTGLRPARWLTPDARVQVVEGEGFEGKGR